MHEGGLRLREMCCSIQFLRSGGGFLRRPRGPSVDFLQCSVCGSAILFWFVFNFSCLEGKDLMIFLLFESR